MPEKIIFEFRTIQGDDGTSYEIHHPEDGIKVKMPVEAYESCSVHNPNKRRKMSKKRNRRMKERSRKHIRHNLDFLEEMYNEFYGEITTGQSK